MKTDLIECSEDGLEDIIGLLMDSVEDFLAEQGVSLPVNGEGDEQEDELADTESVILDGRNYDALSAAFRSTLNEWSDVLLQLFINKKEQSEKAPSVKLSYRTETYTRIQEGASAEDIENGDAYETAYLVYASDGTLLWDTTNFEYVREYFEERN